MRSLLSVARAVFTLLAVLFNKKLVGCNPITNSDSNGRLRELSVRSDNSTEVKTLQREESGRYANFVPGHNPIRFKDSADNALSSSSYSRGLVHHEHPGYPIHGYEETPPYGYEYHVLDSAPHGYDHPGHHGYHGQHHVSYHQKHYDHALAAKAFLWPIAGIALLGAAAALVSNPVLLQLGVVSGKRRRRDTEENFDPELENNWQKNSEYEDSKASGKLKRTEKFVKDLMFSNAEKSYKGDDLKHRFKTKVYSKEQEVQSQAVAEDNILTRISAISKHNNDKKLVPVSLIVKEKKITSM